MSLEVLFNKVVSLLIPPCFVYFLKLFTNLNTESQHHFNVEILFLLLGCLERTLRSDLRSAQVSVEWTQTQRMRGVFVSVCLHTDLRSAQVSVEWTQTQHIRGVCVSAFILISDQLRWVWNEPKPSIWGVYVSLRSYWSQINSGECGMNLNPAYEWRICLGLRSYGTGERDLITHLGDTADGSGKEQHSGVIPLSYYPSDPTTGTPC